jgi:tRNA1Val (adenine37-N6)-methyltransferase
MSEKQGNFTLLNGKVIVHRGIYNPTSDAVWLAAFVPHGIKSVLDVGIGTGGVSLCLKQHQPDIEITGLDISKEMIEECKINMDLNNTKANLIETDINDYSTAQTFDCVITNPPYFNGTPAKHLAHHNANIKKWVEQSAARVKPGGWFCIIVDTLIADKVISSLHKKHFGNLQILPLFGAKITAERVLIRAKQGVKTGMTVYKGLSMNNDSILRDGLTIDSLLATLDSL